MAISHYFVRPTNGADVAGQGTTHATAYKTTQFALDDVGGTHGRNVEDGDQINICDSSLEGADILAAPLSLAAYGAPSITAALRLCGYTATVDDGGIGELSGGGAVPIWDASGQSHVTMRHLHCHNVGANSVIYLGSYNNIVNCEIDTAGVNGVRGNSTVVGCHIHDVGQYGVMFGTVMGCFIEGCGSYCLYDASAYSNVLNTTALGIMVGTKTIVGNVIIKSGGIAGAGINGANAWNIIANNIICGWGTGISTIYVQAMVGPNAYYNNATNENVTKTPAVYHNSVQLLADPFTNAAGGDFSLTEAAQAALRSAGWPASYLGASTDPHITIGAVQYGEGGGSGVIRRAMRILGG